MIGLRSSLLLNIGYFEKCSLIRFMKDCILSLEIPTKCSLIRISIFKRIFSLVFMIEVAHYIPISDVIATILSFPSPT